MPNPNLLKIATKITEIGFKQKNKLLAPYTTKKGDQTLYLLKRSGTNGKPFKLLASFQNFGVDTESTQLRSRQYYELAKSEKTFGEANNQSLGEIIGVASHFAVVPDGEIFSIKMGDELQVQQTDFTYRLFGQLTGQRFNLSTDV